MNKLNTVFASAAIAGCATLWTATAAAHGGEDCTAGVFLDETPLVFDGIVPASESGATFLDTINFCISETHTLFNMTSVFSSNILGGGASIFENEADAQVPGGANSPSFTDFDLHSTEAGYHLHPQGFIQGGTGGGTYHLTVWANAPAPVPVPAAAWLLMSGLTGLGVLARRTVPFA